MDVLEADVLFSATKSFMDVLLENLALPVWYKDEQDRFIGCNSALTSFLGKTKAEIIGRTVYDVFPKDLAEVLNGFDQQVRQAGHSCSFEAQLPHADDSQHQVILFLAPFFQKAGVIGGVSGNLVDITESKRREKLSQSIIKSRDKLLAMLGHDLRAPVAKVQQLLTAYQDQRDMFSPAEWQQIWQDLRKSTDSVRNLLENLFLWSLSEQGMLQPDLQLFDIKELILEVIDLFLSIATTKEITLTPEIFVQSQVFSDRNMIAAILRNLIGNALKFTPRGGLITIRVYEDVDGNLAISVKDTGVGISPQNLERIFSEVPAVQVRGTEQEKGSGFGLNLCRDLASVLGGRMSVESEFGQGSKFTFTLPLDEL